MTKAARLTSDIFVPELWAFSDKLPHHLDAFGQIEVDHLDAVAAHEFRSTRESPAFACHHPWDTKLHDRAAPEVARHEGGIENGVARISDPPGVAQAIDLGLGDRIAFLHAFVVTCREQLAPARQRIIRDR